ncbi:MAG TPA: RIO1 family regulatory kinase/ATPase [Acidimicrobiales bacterium]|nr:RIO1 family regulatory kinase/ATPase [Acidimicrobiales bacterium]
MLHHFTPEPGPRPAPHWLPTGDIEDEVVGSLKTGKEAEVVVVERRSLDDGRSCLLAHKRYRPLTAGRGELEAQGFSRSRTFVDDTIYHEGRRFRRSRDRRAVAKMTGHGKKLLGDRWVGHELDTMRTLWNAGADVPYPVELQGDGMLMELIGDATQAAPRLVSARLSTPELASAFEQVTSNLRILARASIVHADLSAYNVLWWQGRISVIDLPQATDLLLNPHGIDLLHRDVVRMCEWFTRKGHDCDAEELFADVLAEAWS